MSGSKKRLTCLLAGMLLTLCLGTTGCQVYTGGQTLPSPNYLSDDVQYFPAGPEMKLAREAAAMQATRQEMAAQQPMPGS